MLTDLCHVTIPIKHPESVLKALPLMNQRSCIKGTKSWATLIY